MAVWQPVGPRQSRKVKMSMVIDQLYDPECLALSAVRVRETRAAFRAGSNGIWPPAGDTPSAGQYTALEHKLSCTQDCFVDFGVWRPNGARLAKVLKLTAQHLLPNGDYLPYEVAGPADYSLWRRGWRVYDVGMRALIAATFARLQLYERRIESFAEEYKDHWWLVAQADYRMRYEQFPEILADLQGTHDAATGLGAAARGGGEAHLPRGRALGPQSRVHLRRGERV